MGICRGKQDRGQNSRKVLKYRDIASAKASSSPASCNYFNQRGEVQLARPTVRMLGKHSRLRFSVSSEHNRLTLMVDHGLLLLLCASSQANHRLRARSPRADAPLPHRQGPAQPRAVVLDEALERGRRRQSAQRYQPHPVST